MAIPLKTAHRVLLTKVAPRSLKETLEAENSLLELKIPVFHTFIRQYKVHERAVLEEFPITEWRGRNAKEAQEDYCRIIEKLP